MTDTGVRRETLDGQPQMVIANGGWIKGLAGVAVAGIVAGIIAWATVGQHERRLTSVEAIQLSDGRDLIKTTAEVQSVKEWMIRLDGKLDKVLNPKKRRRR